MYAILAGDMRQGYLMSTRLDFVITTPSLSSLPNAGPYDRTVDGFDFVGCRTRFPREAVQDGDTMRIIAEAAAKQVKKISSGSTG